MKNGYLVVDERGNKKKGLIYIEGEIAENPRVKVVFLRNTTQIIIF